MTSWTTPPLLTPQHNNLMRLQSYLYFPVEADRHRLFVTKYVSIGQPRSYGTLRSFGNVNTKCVKTLPEQLQLIYWEMNVITITSGV
jgi:hypothetical protein